MKVGPGVGDIFPGSLLAFAVVAALRHAERTGSGQQVEVAMYDAIVALCERAVYQYGYTGRSPSGEGPTHPFLAPFGMFPASDGWISLAAQNDNFWNVLVEIMGQPELKTQPGFSTKLERTENRERVNELVREWTRNQSKAELKRLLGGECRSAPFRPPRRSSKILTSRRAACWRKSKSPMPEQAPRPASLERR